MMLILLISSGLVVISFIAAMVVNPHSSWITNNYSKIALVTMSVLLAFTVVELVPIAVEYSHNGLIFIVLGILVPLLFHHGGQEHTNERKVHLSLKLLMIGACLHSFIDGTIMITGILAGTSLGLLVILSMLLHKFTEMIMFSLILASRIKRKINLFLYLLGINFFTVLGMVIASFLVTSPEIFSELTGIAISLSSGIFIHMSLTTLSTEISRSRLKFANIYPFVGCAIYFGLHVFMH
ncbi:ZIP family metal transporter [Paenibacillus sp. M2]|uniref:ZIP family metal transporter n=1 Tax=Paenibacillus sp. M2 TaxID=3341793 RepID=UPI003989DB73